MNNPLPALGALCARTTRRQRTVALYAAAGTLALAIGWSTYRVLFPPPFDYAGAVFSREISTDNGVHPVFLPADDTDSQTYDLLVVQNLSDKPLALFAFTARPREASPDTIMSSWALWIAKAKQAVTINPGYTWTIDPNDTDKLPFVHGRTWLAVFYEPVPENHPNALPSALLPDTYKGSFRVYFCRSQIEPEAVALPQLHRQALIAALRNEADLTPKRFFTLPPLAIAGRNGLTVAELR